MVGQFGAVCADAALTVMIPASARTGVIAYRIDMVVSPRELLLSG
jgi:hypothetical protein